MVTPLQLDGRRLGVVYLDSQVAKGIFDAADAGILVALTNHIAVSLETARAAQLEISAQAARRERDLAHTLREAMQAMAGTFDQPEVLDRLLAALKPRNVVFSAFGLREGFYYSRLSEAERARHPLIAFAEEQGADSRRFDVAPA